MPKHISATTAKVETAIIARMLMCGIDVPEALKEFVGKQREEAWIPNPEASGATVPGPKGLWVAVDPIPAYVDAGWMPAENPFSGRTDTAMARRILDDARIDAAIVAPAMSMLVDIEQVEHVVLVEAVEALKRRLNDAPLDRTEPAHHALMEVFAKICAVLGRNDLFDATLISVASGNARKWPNERIRVNRDESGSALDALLNSALVFAITSGGPLIDQMRTFSSRLEDIANAWPTANSAVISCLDVVVRKVDAPTAAGALWPALIGLRTRR
ncbi:hypothetical protein ABLE93_26345 [Xanthobacter sp. KR7-65]|uniref:hypothetical protein n=1 Tax=Xanthobacter sp. KR7-65 TaxID=3156612 RepID=UPI0032B5716D